GFTISNVSVSPASASPGQTVTISFSVRSSAAGIADIAVPIASATTTIRNASITGVSFNAGQTKSWKFRHTLASNTKPDTYYISVLVSQGGVIKARLDKA